MISIDYGIHLRSKTNSRGHWTRAAQLAARQRAIICGLVDVELYRWIGRGPYELRREKYTGRFRGAPVEKVRFTRVLDPVWQKRLDGGIKVTLTRQAERPLDSDNICDAFKSIRDGVADAFGIADNDKRIAFAYDQVKGSPSGINVRIQWQEEAHAAAATA